MKYQQINNITGWAVFAISMVVYLLTVEPTASFWDCGEFIATSYKLEVPHPPGAPFYLLIGRMFSLFAGDDVTRVAYWVNIVSVLSSAFSVMFIFWSVTHLCRKFFRLGDNEPNTPRVLLIIGSGILAALTLTFSDSFWFSAVEAEVYGMSSFFTAFVFWAILKWENIKDESDANKWLILIAYMMGLSIGVHLLNLVTIPALALIVYFKRHKNITATGVIATLAISAGILLTILIGVIPGIPSLAASFEIFFVNSFGMPFYSGIIFFLLLFVGVLVFGVWYSIKNQLVNVNTFLLGFIFILIGNASYTVVLVRSNFNPPIDENDPENILTYVSYLKREQYGDRPLFKGPHFNATPDATERGATVYMRKGDKYVEKDFKLKYTYKDGDEVLFPRMYSNQPSHVQAYLQKSGLREGVRPKFPDHFAFMMSHQLKWMYFRYFMWNFSGRAHDEKEADYVLLPTQDVPKHIADNKGRNIYFGLPLLLGLLGMFFQYRKDPKNFAVTGLLFILTGIALVLYLNSPPVEPRERDYIYTGSYYAFCIWVGIGVFALFEILNSFLKSEYVASAGAFVLALFIPLLMGAQNWDDHDRSDRYFSVEAAKNYLDSCAPNAILFTGGDNDTFPLWYAQEVENYRTDVRVIVLSYFNTDWYINQMMRKAYESDPVPFTLTADNYIQGGLNDAVFATERIQQPINARTFLNALKNNNPALQFDAGLSKYNSLPSKKLFINVDSAAVASMDIVPYDMRIANRIDFSVKGRMLEKKDLAILDILATNNWERPVYFNTTSLNQVNLELRRYALQEGLTYRVLPVVPESSDTGVNTEVMYDNLMNNFHWKGLDDESVYYSEDYRNFCLNHRASFGTLAENLIAEGQIEKAKEVLLHGLKSIPHETIPYDNFNVAQVGSLLTVGAVEEAQKVADIMAERADDVLGYFERNLIRSSRESQLNKYVLAQM
ncbi:MAG: DUF2723 domain-containing protein, partial [Bacteroidota bacterium]